MCHRVPPVPLTVAVLLALCALLWPASPALAAPDGDLVKVYVVKSPDQNGGLPENLRSIAQRTLGDPGRWSEIFALNQNRPQDDGGALTDPADLHPGWLLRLPKDASGPEVRMARETTTLAGYGIPLPAAIAAVVAVLLGLVTAGVLARRRLRAAALAVGRRAYRLGDPVRRSRRRRYRASLTAALAQDLDAPARAARAVQDLAAREPSTRGSVHAVVVDREDVTAWVDTAAWPPAPWEPVDRARWRLASRQAPARTTLSGPAVAAPLARAGVRDDGGQVFVNLGRLDGILSLTGDADVARDVVHGLMADVLRTHPGLPVAVVGGPPAALPPGATLVNPAELFHQAPPWPSGRGGGAVRATARRRDLRGLLVVTGTPTAAETERLHAVCAAGGLGWTGLVCGDVDGAHWRWHAADDGNVTIPTLNVTVTAPACRP
ncbi:hypothetical protein ACIBP6_33245 [Nonomuraea terrae]|uniref:hypothetical protein n=1 Tax=Nonomuraea terrae TaxID=2530383 RepID=UPI0037ABF453